MVAARWHGWSFWRWFVKTFCSSSFRHQRYVLPNPTCCYREGRPLVRDKTPLRIPSLVEFSLTRWSELYCSGHVCPWVAREASDKGSADKCWHIISLSLTCAGIGTTSSLYSENTGLHSDPVCFNHQALLGKMDELLCESQIMNQPWRIFHAKMKKIKYC